jgi:DHA1 family tetracycline resistance protein-like MFS transporter
MALAPGLVWLFIGRVISGITAATFSTATAYIADVTPPEDRAAKFGLIGAAFGLGFVLGPAIGGLLGASDPRLPFWVAAAASLTATAYGVLVLPESLPPEKRSAFTWRTASPAGSLRLLSSHPMLLRLSGAMFLYHLAHGVFPAVFVLHAGYRFGWDASMVGLSLAGFGICSAIVQGALVSPVVGKLGERRALLLGMCLGVASFIVMSMARSTLVFWATMPVMALWGFIGPAAQGLMTRLVGPDMQGRLQGAGSSLMGVASLIAPTLFSLTFAAGIDPARGAPLPGAPYLVAALLLALALVVVWTSVTPDAGSKSECRA